LVFAILPFISSVVRSVSSLFKCFLQEFYDSRKEYSFGELKASWPMGFFLVAFLGAACFIISHICVDSGYTAGFITVLGHRYESRFRFSLKAKDPDPDYTPSVLT